MEVIRSNLVWLRSFAVLLVVGGMFDKLWQVSKKKSLLFISEEMTEKFLLENFTCISHTKQYMFSVGDHWSYDGHSYSLFISSIDDYYDSG